MALASAVKVEVLLGNLEDIVLDPVTVAQATLSPSLDPSVNKGNGFSSSGREFLVAFPENVKPDQQCVIITTVLDAASVQVTAPSINYMDNVTISSWEGGYICMDGMIQLSGSGISDKVVHILSDNDVNVLAADYGLKSMDTYLALPVSGFGFSFYVVTYQSVNDKSHFSVISSTANTVVTVEFPPGLSTLDYNGIVIKKPSTIIVTLEKHEVMQFLNDKDLTGVYVSSNEPIAVIAGAKKSKLDTDGTSDHLVQQMTPVTTWGKHFVSVISPGKTSEMGELYRVLASTANTTVRVNGTVYNLAKEGDWFEAILQATDPVEVESNKAILLAKFVRQSKSFDPCMTIVVPNTQWQHRYSFRFPDTYKGVSAAHVVIVIDSHFKSSLMLNSAPLDIQNWVDVENTNLTSGYILLQTAYHVIQSSSAVFAVYLHQKNKHTGAFCSMAGMNLKQINANWTHSQEKAEDCVPSIASAMTPTTVSTPAAAATSATTTTVKPSSRPTTAMAATTITTTMVTTTISFHAADAVTSSTTSTLRSPSTSVIDVNESLPDNCTCEGSSRFIHQNMSLEQLQIIVNHLQTYLRVLPNQTSRSIRKKCSAPDDRPLSKTLGLTGCIFLSLCAIVVFLGDAPRIIRHLRGAICKRNLRNH
ncbi:uncharacterized protein [Haliotis asinina]|uniref:uncharacterized protein n=1 Tax=Haliotis asinina TaxID=109174 RepID=UPI0035327B1A